MRDAEFRAWLEAKGVTPKAAATRLYAVRTIERKLKDLGLTDKDLDAAFDRDRLSDVRAAMKAVRDELAVQGERYKLLMPQSHKPAARLASWRSWLAQYGRFREAAEATAGVSAWPELDDLREAFLVHCPDFVSFEQPGTGWARSERHYKDETARKVVAIVEAGGTDAAIGAAAMQALRTAAKDGPLIRWQTEDTVRKRSPALAQRLYAAVGKLLRDGRAAPGPILDALDALRALREAGAGALTFGERNSIVYSTRSMVRPGEACPMKIARMNEIGRRLIGESLFDEQRDAASDYAAFSFVFDRVFAVMGDEWGWRPRDRVDVQGFLWIATTPEEIEPEDQQSGDNEASAPRQADIAMDEGRGRFAPMPTNLILYGPPGTGKTYATVEHAVRLCGEAPPAGRAELMARYKALSEAGRIEFVTFHQSMAYEDFVEGLRPETGSTEGETEDGEALSGGFRLRPRDGIFKQVSERARLSAGPDGVRHLDRRRRMFKIALGRRGDEEDRIAEGLDRGLIHLGWGGEIDWSDERFDSFAGIKRHWQEEVDPNATGKDPNIEVTSAFRVWMRPGDYVILSDGRDLVRGVAEVTGEYFYDPTARYHPHRREVRWLWQDSAGVSRDRFYPRQFRRHSTYQLAEEAIDWDALDTIVFGEAAPHTGSGDPHVLVIDEINRANISKVFGELITLLEGDKRIGAANELRVRLPYSGDMFGVPANLHVIGTMNTADRSIALIDKALRRRFTFAEMMPDYTVPGMADAVAGAGVTLAEVLRTINDRIEYLLDREHQIGHGWLLGCDTRATLDTKMRDAVIPLIAEYFFEDWGRTADVLGGREGNPFLDAHVLAPPPGMTGEEPRVRWTVKAEFAEDAFIRLVAGR